MHCGLGLLLNSLCGVFGTPEVQKTAGAWFMQTEGYYCSILEQFILQKFIVKARIGFRVTFKWYQRSSETSEPILHLMLTLSRNSRPQFNSPRPSNYRTHMKAQV